MLIICVLFDKFVTWALAEESKQILSSAAAPSSTPPTSAAAAVSDGLGIDSHYLGCSASVLLSVAWALSIGMITESIIHRLHLHGEWISTQLEMRHAGVASYAPT